MNNFGFVLSDVCLGSIPTKPGHITKLKQEYNVGLVITLTKESPLPQNWFDGQSAIRNLFAPIKNYHSNGI